MGTLKVVAKKPRLVVPVPIDFESSKGKTKTRMAHKHEVFLIKNSFHSCFFLSLSEGSLSFHGPLLRIPLHYIHEYESLRSLRFNVLANQTNGATTEISWSPMSWVHGIDPRLFHSPACHSLLSDHWDRIMNIFIIERFTTVHPVNASEKPHRCRREKNPISNF